MPERREVGPAAAAAIDLVVVLGFALAGRRSHDEALDLRGLADTAWPFVVGLGLGWVLVLLVLRRSPVSWIAGVLVWLATLAGGMALRDMSGQGTALPFVLVATGVLAAGLIGWRVVVAAATR